MDKFRIDFGDYTLAFEDASGTPFYDYKNPSDDEGVEREVKSIKDIMYFYNSIVVYGKYSDEPLFKSSPPDDSIVEYLNGFIKNVEKTKKENSQYNIYESDGFIRKTWTKVFSMMGIGYSPKISIIKEWYSVKQRHDDKFSNSVWYNITFSDGLDGEGKAFVLESVNKSGLLEIGKQADSFVKNYIDGYYDNGK